MSYNSDTRLSRQRQITTLKVYNENVEETIENVEFRIKCNLQSVQLNLIVKVMGMISYERRSFDPKCNTF